MQASTAVHELVGGVVEHVPSDEQEGVSETGLMLQKLYSMNLMAYEGSDPNLEFWEVRRPTDRLAGRQAGGGEWEAGQHCRAVGCSPVQAAS